VFALHQNAFAIARGVKIDPAIRAACPHFSHRSWMMAKGFAPRARRKEEEWLFHCDDEQRSPRRKDQARATKRKDASDSLRREPK